MIEAHLQKLHKLEPGNINYMHRFLCRSGNESLIGVSKRIVALYELAESEREPEIRREKHGISDSTYPDYADYRRSFFKNPDPRDPRNTLVELEYFLNLLYSISFSLYLSRKNHQEFNLSFLAANRSHLPVYESCLGALEHLYVTLDILSVLVVLVCGINRHPKGIYFTKIGEELRESLFKSNFRLSDYDLTAYPISLLNAIRNMRAHRPFLNWDDAGNIVSKPQNLSKVRSVCDRHGLFDKQIDIFVQDAFSGVTSIAARGLGGVFDTYIDRLEGRVSWKQPHEKWERFLT